MNAAEITIFSSHQNKDGSISKYVRDWIFAITLPNGQIIRDGGSSTKRQALARAEKILASNDGRI